MQAGRHWIWIEGNHDPGPVEMGGTHLAELLLPPLTFRHIACPGKCGEISGHYHPKTTLHARGRTVTRPAFLIDADRVVMPAYGTYTGGLASHDAALRALMETNFFGAAVVTQEVLPGMRRQGSGAIVMMSSMGGQMSFAGFGPYSASKFALEGMTEALAQELAPLGITAMIVEPGAFRTEFAGDALRQMPKLPGYAETVGGTRSFARDMDGTQPGDPAKAAAAIAAALAAAQPPLRLQLGADSVDAVRAHAEALLAERRGWEETARAVAHDGEVAA